MFDSQKLRKKENRHQKQKESEEKIDSKSKN